MGGGPKGGGPKILLFFLSPAGNFIFLSLSRCMWKLILKKILDLGIELFYRLLVDFLGSRSICGKTDIIEREAQKKANVQYGVNQNLKN